MFPVTSSPNNTKKKDKMKEVCDPYSYSPQNVLLNELIISITLRGAFVLKVFTQSCSYQVGVAKIDGGWQVRDGKQTLDPAVEVGTSRWIAPRAPNHCLTAKRFSCETKSFSAARDSSCPSMEENSDFFQNKICVFPQKGYLEGKGCAKTKW